MELQRRLHAFKNRTARQLLQQIDGIQIVPIDIFYDTFHHVAIAVARTDFPVSERLQAVCLDISRKVFHADGRPILEHLAGLGIQIAAVKIIIIPFDGVYNARRIDALIFFYRHELGHRCILGLVHFSAVYCDICHLLQRNAYGFHHRVLFDAQRIIDRTDDDTCGDNHAKGCDEHALCLLSIGKQQQDKNTDDDIQAVVAEENRAEQQQHPFDHKFLILKQRPARLHRVKQHHREKQQKRRKQRIFPHNDRIHRKRLWNGKECQRQNKIPALDALAVQPCQKPCVHGRHNKILRQRIQEYAEHDAAERRADSQKNRHKQRVKHQKMVADSLDAESLIDGMKRVSHNGSREIF